MNNTKIKRTNTTTSTIQNNDIVWIKYHRQEKTMSTIKIITTFYIIILSFFTTTIVVYAHPGQTDSNGGHYDRSTGEYHYHHGYSAHYHTDGICPYDYDDRTYYSNTNANIAENNTKGKKTTNNTIKNDSNNTTDFSFLFVLGGILGGTIAFLYLEKKFKKKPFLLHKDVKNIETEAIDKKIKPTTRQISYKYICPRCHGKLILKNGKYGRFYGCSNYPKCRFTRNYKK